jgi:hypothetical protein
LQENETKRDEGKQTGQPDQKAVARLGRGIRWTRQAGAGGAR